MVGVQLHGANMGGIGCLSKISVKEDCLGGGGGGLHTFRLIPTLTTLDLHCRYAGMIMVKRYVGGVH